MQPRPFASAAATFAAPAHPLLQPILILGSATFTPHEYHRGAAAPR